MRSQGFMARKSLTVFAYERNYGKYCIHFRVKFSAFIHAFVYLFGLSSLEVFIPFRIPSTRTLCPCITPLPHPYTLHCRLFMPPKRESPECQDKFSKRATKQNRQESERVTETKTETDRSKKFRRQ